MFNAMTESIREETSRLILSVQIRNEEQVHVERFVVILDLYEFHAGSDAASKTVRGKGKVSKNALCPCGSGKKYKRCCGKDEE